MRKNGRYRREGKKLFAILFSTMIFCFLAVSAGATTYSYNYILPTGWYDAQVSDMNQSGVVAGYGRETSTSAYTGFVYYGAEYIPLPNPGGWSEWMAIRINDNEVVLVCGTKDGDSTCATTQFDTSASLPYTWPAYTTVMAPDPDWDYDFSWMDLNDAGAITYVGYSGGSYYAFLYEPGTPTYTPLTPPDASSHVYVSAVNSALNNAVVGEYYYGSDYWGYLYSGGIYTILNPGEGWTSSRGIDIDGLRVLGDGDQNGASKAFLYITSSQLYTDLLPANFSQSWASKISTSGHIIAHGIDADGADKAFLYSGSYNIILPSRCNNSYPSDINSSDVVLGFCFDVPRKGGTKITKVFTYSQSGAGGTNSIVDPKALSLIQPFPVRIIDDGKVIGNAVARVKGNKLSRGFMATPVP